MPWQGLEIQASASSRASPFGLQAWGVAAPFPQLLASCPQWKTLQKGCWGAAGGLLGWVCPPTERCLVPRQRVLRKASFTPSACWGANGVLPTWRDSRWQMQSERAFFLVIHIC